LKKNLSCFCLVILFVSSYQQLITLAALGKIVDEGRENHKEKMVEVNLKQTSTANACSGHYLHVLFIVCSL